MKKLSVANVSSGIARLGGVSAIAILASGCAFNESGVQINYPRIPDVSLADANLPRLRSPLYWPDQQVAGQQRRQQQRIPARGAPRIPPPPRPSDFARPTRGPEPITVGDRTSPNFNARPNFNAGVVTAPSIAPVSGSSYVSTGALPAQGSFGVGSTPTFGAPTIDLGSLDGTLATAPVINSGFSPASVSVEPVFVDAAPSFPATTATTLAIGEEVGGFSAPSIDTGAYVAEPALFDSGSVIGGTTQPVFGGTTSTLGSVQDVGVYSPAPSIGVGDFTPTTLAIGEEG